MIGQILQELRNDTDFETVHWPFLFSRDLRTLRRVQFGKVLELFRCAWRLLRIRLAGPVDLLLYPAGGPHLVPILRDIFLLPFARLAGRKLVIQFHAAGIAERLKRPNLFYRLLARFIRTADSAIVMTNYNRIDPQTLGIEKIDVIPIRIVDHAPRNLPPRQQPRFLYVGHLCPDKGTPALLEAFGQIRLDFPDARLELAGEPLRPYDRLATQADIARFGISSALDYAGILTGQQKWEAYARASLFIFPTIAPYESFGLVLAEAMMFGLPILATDWRGNRDVLGEPPGGIIFPPHQQLARQIEQAIRDALAQRNKWESWGRLNRERFESHFKQQVGNANYIDFVRRELTAS